MNGKPLSENSPGAVRLSRRDALKVVGTGIIVVLGAPYTADAEQLPNSYLRIDADGLITLYTHKTELGQGISTALAQIAAEELDAPLGSMRVIAGDTSLCYQVTGDETWGSLTINDFGPKLRDAAAKARVLLIKVAVEHLSLPEQRLFTRDGLVIDRENETVRVSYATLAGNGTVNRTIPAVTPKDPANFSICGKPAVRIDAIEKVTGKALYAGDISLPGMLYARILRPPAHGATFRAPPDTSAAEQIPGVEVGPIGTALVAVLHPSPDVADQALSLVTPEYNLPPNGPTDVTMPDYILSHPPAQVDSWSGGNVVLGESQLVSKSDQTYYTPFVAHAPMEPHAAVASYANGAVKVWASTQAPFQTKNAVAATLGMSAANVQVVTPYVGGAFGGKSFNNKQAVEAAQLSKALGKPVNVTWTRGDEFFYDHFQPPCLVKIRAGVNVNQQICFWDSQAFFTSSYHMTWGGIYNIPNHRTLFYGHWYNAANPPTNLPFPVGPWRAPGNNAFTFARESHIDVLAVAARIDPVEFRLKHLKNNRARNVLAQAAEAFGWEPARTPTGRGFGVACGQNGDATHEVYVAVFAEVSVDLTTGAITVIRMLSAQDCGRVINPDGVRQQMEGSLMMGMGYSLSEEVHFQAPAITDLNFDSYSIPRFSSMPQLETIIVPNDALEPKGSGEPPIVAVGAALANAFFDATGLRANRLPITPERVLAMLQAAPPPNLNAPEYSDGQVRLSWIRRPGIRLQKAANANDTIWEDIPLAPGQCTISLPATEPKAFFRLVKP